MIALKTVRVSYLVGAYGFAAIVEPTWPVVDGLALVSMSGGWRVVPVAEMRDSRAEAVAEYSRRGESRRKAKLAKTDIFATTLPVGRPDSGDVESIAA